MNINENLSLVRDGLFEKGYVILSESEQPDGSFIYFTRDGVTREKEGMKQKLIGSIFLTTKHDAEHKLACAISSFESYANRNLTSQLT